MNAQRVIDRVRPFALFTLGLAVLAGMLKYGLPAVQAPDPSLIAYYEPPLVTVSSPEQARIDVIHVSTGQSVEAGQLLATLESGSLEAELAVADAELGRLRAERNAVRSGYQLESSRRRSEAVSQTRRTRASTADVVSRFVSQQSELQAIETEVGLLEPLVQSGHRTSDELRRLRSRATTLRASLPSAQAALRAHRAAGAAPEAEGSIDELIAPFERAIDVGERRREHLALRVLMYEIRALRAGRVDAQFRRSGEIVAAGEPILRLHEAGEGQMVVCLPEATQSPPSVGESIELSSVDGRTSTIRIEAITAGLQPLPQSCARSSFGAAPLGRLARGRASVAESPSSRLLARRLDTEEGPASTNIAAEPAPSLEGAHAELGPELEDVE